MDAEPGDRRDRRIHLYVEMTDDFAKYISEVAARTAEQGGTASKPMTREFLPAMDVWSFPKYPARTAILPQTVDLAHELREFIQRNEAVLNEADCWLGTWINPQSGDYYLDVATGVTDLAEARRVAMEVSETEGRRIVALFNAKRNKIIYLCED